MREIPRIRCNDCRFHPCLKLGPYPYPVDSRFVSCPDARPREIGTCVKCAWFDGECVGDIRCNKGMVQYANTHIDVPVDMLGGPYWWPKSKEDDK